MVAFAHTLMISIGLHNTSEGIDKLLYALNNIANGVFTEDYYLDYQTGAYIPKSWDCHYQDYFEF